MSSSDWCSDWCSSYLHRERIMQFVQRPARTDHAVEVETPLAIEIEIIRHVELEAVRAHHRAGDAPFAAEEAARLDLKLFARGNGADKHRGAAGSERGEAFAEQVGASDCIDRKSTRLNSSH